MKISVQISQVSVYPHNHTGPLLYTVLFPNQLNEGSDFPPPLLLMQIFSQQALYLQQGWGIARPPGFCGIHQL